jgi:hypothetical protein
MTRCSFEVKKPSRQIVANPTLYHGLMHHYGDEVGHIVLAGSLDLDADQRARQFENEPRKGGETISERIFIHLDKNRGQTRAQACMLCCFGPLIPESTE